MSCLLLIGLRVLLFDLEFPAVAKSSGSYLLLATVQRTCDERKNGARPLRQVAGRPLPRAGERSGEGAGSAAT
jgi:hypothetical protein